MPRTNYLLLIPHTYKYLPPNAHANFVRRRCWLHFTFSQHLFRNHHASSSGNGRRRATPFEMSRFCGVGFVWYREGEIEGCRCCCASGVTERGWFPSRFVGFTGNVCLPACLHCNWYNMAWHIRVRHPQGRCTRAKTLSGPPKCFVCLLWRGRMSHRFLSRFWVKVIYRCKVTTDGGKWMNTYFFLQLKKCDL